jgi:hypothetical protein
MMYEAHVKLNPGFPCKSGVQPKEVSLVQEIGFKGEEETCELVHLEHSFVLC